MDYMTLYITLSLITHNVDYILSDYTVYRYSIDVDKIRLECITIEILQMNSQLLLWKVFDCSLVESLIAKKLIL